MIRDLECRISSLERTGLDMRLALARTQARAEVYRELLGAQNGFQVVPAATPSREPKLLLINSGPEKIKAIREIRAATGLDLKAAKDLADVADGIRQVYIPVYAGQVESLAKALNDVGATVQVV